MRRKLLAAALAPPRPRGLVAVLHAGRERASCKEGAMPRVRMLIAPLALVRTLLVAAPAASAEPVVTTTRHTVRETVSWTLPADQCKSLPAGVAVTGTGARDQAIVTRVRADGSGEHVIDDLVMGTAVDSKGGTYTFLYYNNNTEEVPPRGSGLPIQVRMDDVFVLHGADGTVLTVSFSWRWTYAPPAAPWPPVDNWERLSTRDDALTCDPI